MVDPSRALLAERSATDVGRDPQRRPSRHSDHAYHAILERKGILMNILAIENVDVVRLRLAGRFDAHEAAAFRAAISPLTDRDGARVAVDLSEVNFVDSTALAELVRSMKHCRERGGDLVLEYPSKPVSVILQLTGLELAFSVIR